MDANNGVDDDQNMDIGDVNCVCRRESDNVPENRRNVRQNLDQENIFTPATEQNIALGMNNIHVVWNETAGFTKRRLFNPSSILVPISMFLCVESNHGF